MNVTTQQPWAEITKDEYTEALNCLPPEKWITIRGVNIFRMCEYQNWNTTRHYAKLGGRYFMAVRQVGDNYDEIAAEVFAASAAPIPAPGPFPLRFSAAETPLGGTVIITAQGNHYATTYDPEAARMIVAAPDILQSLSALLWQWDNHGTLMGMALQDARAAIARATRERGEG